MTLPDDGSLVYAGIGSRQTPADTLQDMTTISAWLAKTGWHLSSGGADGADNAFAKGAPTNERSVFLPWKDYNKLSGADCIILTPAQLQNCMAVAERLHPTWERCKPGARRLHARNAAILLGPNLDSPVNAVIAWTPGGALKGGTAMGIRIAAEHGIPVLNLASMTPRQACEQLKAIRDTHLSASTAHTQEQSPRTQTTTAPAPIDTKTNIYKPSDVCGFRFTRDTYGAFSNFQPLSKPIAAGSHTFASSEHLYQAAKFGPTPDVQQRIASASAARDAAQLGRSSKGIHPDWNAQRIDVMRWIIRVKHETNPQEIGTLLAKTANKPIVEISTKDAFWGAKPRGNTLEGANVLGRLWTELREHIRTNHPAAHSSAWTDRIDIGRLAPSATLSRKPDTAPNITTADIFAQSSEAIVNPVNCAGVMGKGLAAEFKKRYPAAFTAYRDACAEHRLQPGSVFLHDTGKQNPRWIVHFPTKQHWRNPSVLSDIDAGLRDLALAVKRHDIKSIAVPALGCGLGGLDWQEVRPLILQRLGDTPAAITLLEPRGQSRDTALQESPDQRRQAPASTDDTAQAPRTAATREPIIYNLKHDPDALKQGAVRIDRQTKWGNPFRVGEHGTRDQVIALYQKDLWKRIRSDEISLTDLAALNGKDMACHCSPKACHGDVLSRAATWAAAQIDLKTQQQIAVSPAAQNQQEPTQQKATANHQDQTPAPAAVESRIDDAAITRGHNHSPSPDGQEASIAQTPASDLKHLLIAATHQNRQARAANIDPVLMPGREALALAAQQYIQDVDTATLTPMQRMDLDGIIDNQQRHNDCTKEIHETSTRLESTLQTYSDLQFMANGNGMEVSTLNAYEEWIIDARELSEHCQRLILEHEVYDSAFTPHSWDNMTTQLLELDTAITEDSFYLRNKDLYLPPLAYDPSASTEEQQTHTAYRALRDKWHETVNEAEAYSYDNCHIYNYENPTKHMNTADTLIKSDHLPDQCDRALILLREDHVGYQNAHTDIETHLQDINTALDKNDTFVDTLDKLDRLDVTIQDIDGFSTWKEDSQKLVDNTAYFTELEDVNYDRYFKSNPDALQTMQASKSKLQDAIERFTPAETKRKLAVAAQHEHHQQQQSTKHSISM